MLKFRIVTLMTICFLMMLILSRFSISFPVITYGSCSLPVIMTKSPRLFSRCIACKTNIFGVKFSKLNSIQLVVLSQKDNQVKYKKRQKIDNKIICSWYPYIKVKFSGIFYAMITVKKTNGYNRFASQFWIIVKQLRIIFGS